MSANINSLFYTGEKPWHGLGTRLPHLSTAAEAIEAAGLNFTIEKEPLFLDDKSPVPNHYATVRQDTKQVLGVVGSRYTILQNKDAFRFFDAVVGIKEAIYETAGALGVGEKIWLLAKLNGVVRTIREDITNKYLLLSNTHDGSGSIQVLFTPIRVVCQNTLNVAIDGATNKVRLRHTLNVGERIDEVRQQLGIVNQKFALFEEASQKLATVKLTQQTFKEYLNNSGVVPKNNEEDQSNRAKRIIEEVSALFDNGKGTEIRGVKGTAWGAFNAVAEYVDHKRGNNLNKRAQSLLFGSGAQIKQHAWNEALALARKS